MILTSLYTRSNQLYNRFVYNKFKTYIYDYLTRNTIEEYTKGYSNKQIIILKLYAAFNLAQRVYEKLSETDENNVAIYTWEDIYVRYNLHDVAAELQKSKININDIFDLFDINDLTTDLLPFANNNLIVPIFNYPTNIDLTPNSTDEISDEPYIIYKGTNRQLSILAGTDNNSRPYINEDWLNFYLYIIQDGVTKFTFYWNKAGLPSTPHGTAYISDIRGEIKFTLDSIKTNTMLGMYDIRVLYTDKDSYTDILENTNALNVKI